MSGPAVDWPRIRAVVFDVDGTLYAQRPMRLCCCSMAAPRRGWMMWILSPCAPVYCATLDPVNANASQRLSSDNFLFIMELDGLPGCQKRAQWGERESLCPRRIGERLDGPEDKGIP